MTVTTAYGLAIIWFVIVCHASQHSARTRPTD